MNAFDSPDRIAPAPLAAAPAGRAPVVQDVLTIPRKLPASDKVNIVGLTREQLRDALIAAGATKRKLDGIRVLAKGELTSALNLTVAGASRTAVEAIERAGGKITLTRPVRERAETGAEVSAE